MNKITKWFKKLGKATGKVIRTVAIICHQWGDTGKGKIIDLLAEWAEIIVRGTGGANAGHTIVVNGKKIIVHLVPAGILRPGKINILGSGMVIDPRQLLDEIADLRDNGIECNGRLFLGNNAKLVLPQHLALDRIREMAKSGRLGTTGRGVGPAYEDHYRRTGLVVRDLLNPDVFAKKLEQNLDEIRQLFRGYDPEAVRKIMHHKHLGAGRFYSAREFFNAQEITEAYLSWGERLSPMIGNTDDWLRREVGNKRILLEGAQGTLLSVDYGTYPFVTSSDASLAGLAKGVGLLTHQVDLTLGIVKAYTTRVGEGPFPPEMGGKKSDKWCGGEAIKIAKAEGFASVQEMEREKCGTIGWDETDEFRLGMLLRDAGLEFGATTGRPRRTGWLDLTLLRYAKQFNGPNIILTKLDVLSQCPLIKICTAYEYDGPDYRVDGQHLLRKGDMLSVAIPAAEVLEHCRPVYQEFPGWLCDINRIKSAGKLPIELKRIIRFIEQQAGVTWQMLSVGADRNQTIFRQ